MKIAAIGDLHCRKETRRIVREILGDVEKRADVLAVVGDLTDTGLPEEAEILAPQLAELSIPVVAILGNHDHQSGRPVEVFEILENAGVRMLDRSTVVIDQVGFVGTKGFCGGFGGTLVQPFGEEAVKAFIRTSIDEAVELENALATMQECEKRVGLLHYAPIKETLQGEPQELYPFLGTSRLSDALDRRKVDVIFHGHAHHGSPAGKTPGGIPVYNVCRFVLERHGGMNYCLYEI